jgi:hypothetical protein
MISRLLVAAALAACLTAAPRARADEQSDFEKGRAAYATKNYEDADRRFREMLAPNGGTLHDPALIADARMYWAATMLATGRRADAAAVVEKLLLARPEYEPDPLRFPQEVINFFIDTRTKIIDRINEAKAAAARAAQEAHDREVAEKARAAKRLALLEQLASQEVEVERHSRLFALLPFGAGQFQNGSSTLGWLFLSSESALALAAAVTIPIYRVQLSDAATAHTLGQRDIEDGWIARANTTRAVNLVLVGAFTLTAIAGVVQAELTFVPEVRVERTRAIPQVTLAPTFAPLFSSSDARVVGGTFGFEGRF